jgi:HlyD family secretion protein
VKRLCLLLLPLIVLACSREKPLSYTGIAEGTIVQVPALSAGKLLALTVNEGQEVKSGDLLAVVDTLALHYQVQEIDAGLQELAAQHKLQDVQIDQARADASYIDRKYGRNEALVKAQTLPGQTLDDLGNQRDKSGSQLNVAISQGKILTAKEAQLQAKRRQLRKAIADALIRAPESGVVSTLYLRLGEAATPMKPVLEITSLDTVETTIYLAEKDLPSVKTGQEVKVKLDGRTDPLSGTVSWISPKAEFTPKQVLTPDNRAALAYAVRIRIPNPDRLIKHGQPVEVIR